MRNHGQWHGMMDSQRVDIIFWGVKLRFFGVSQEFLGELELDLCMDNADFISEGLSHRIAPQLC